MKLSFATGSSSLFPYIVLHEVGLPFDAIKIDEHLSGNDYLLGPAYSIADAHLFVVSNWASRTNFDLSPYRSVLAFRERVGARPAVISALTAEGLVPWPSSQPH